MIPYSKQWWGVHLLFRIYGSALPRTLPFVLLSGSLSVFFFYIPSKSYWTSLFLHPYPYQLLAFIIGFILVFRNNLAYSRYWEGRTQLAALMGNLTDVAISCISFQHTSCCCQLGQTQAQAQAKALIHTDPPSNNNNNYCQFCDDLIHLVSLMNGLAIQQLRLDNDISNLYSHNDHCRTSPPPFDAGTLPKTTFKRGHFEWLTLRSSPDRIRRYNSALKVPVIEKGWLLKKMEKEHRLRTRARAGERRGGGGGGFGGVLNGGKHERVSAFFTVDIRGEEEGSNNNDDDDEKSSSSSHKLHVSVRKSLGEWHHHHHLNSNGNPADIHNLASLSSSMPYAADTRVYTCYALLHNMVSQKMLAPPIPPSSSSAPNPSPSPLSHHHHQYWVNAPPTTAGVFRSLSYALVSYEQCRKLATTPFPFPYSQFVVLLMIFFSITAPIMFIGYVQDLWMTTLLSACASATYSGLNEVARDIEDCFIYDPNELPLVRLQWEFNQRLIAAAAAF